MSRAGSLPLARFGLSENPVSLADLATAGLVTGDELTAGADTVLAAISRSGRPELALANLAELSQACGGRRSLWDALRQNRALRARLIGLLGGSAVLGGHLCAEPDDWLLLADEESALPSRESMLHALGGAVGLDTGAPPCTGSGGGVAAASGSRAVAALRRAYRSQLMVIAAADLAPAVETDVPAAPLAEICRALSALADVTMQVALCMAAAALPGHAAPARLGVVAMGKCGGEELNYLSDVDVIFIAGHPAPTPGRAVAGDVAVASDDEMLSTATTLASDMMRLCGQVAWEVDPGLRPEGRAGALVRTLASHQAYYQRWAQTWEFQALLKARPAAGDLDLGEQFRQMAAPLVWHAANRDSFVADVQAMRRRVERSVPAARRDLEIKLGAGGLRDVEFAVQLLQLVHGRTDLAIRQPDTLGALAALTSGGYVGRSDGAELAEAYTFLRRTEHRLQLQRLRRTHLVPTAHDDLEWVARADGLSARGTSDAAAVFTAERHRHAATVRRLHEKLFYRPLLHAVAAVPESGLRLSEQAAADRAAALGFRNPQAVLAHLSALTAGVSRRAAIQRTLLPVLLDTFAQAPDPDAGLLAYRRVSEALAGTPWYLRLLRDEGLVAQRLAALLGESRLVADLLIRAPEVLRLLVSDDQLLAPDSAATARALSARAARAGSAPAAADAARSARRHEMLRIACADLLGLLPVGQVAAALTAVADASVQAAHAAAEHAIRNQRGGLSGRLAVIAMGRFGGAEMGYGSDADVLFVAGPADSPEGDGAALADATAVAEEMTRLLGRPSPDPALSLDAGLRPEGRSGPLVRSLESFQSYWRRFAQPWERQALLRARAVAGDAELGAAFMAAAEPVRYPAGGLAHREVVEIRRIKARVDTERLPRGRADPALNTKLGPGALADIEWTVQLLQLRHAGQHAGLRVTGTLGALAVAVDRGLVGAGDAGALSAGWLMATRVRNALMLTGGKPADQIPAHGKELTAVTRALGYPHGSDPGVFVDDYRRATRQARRVVDRLFDRD